MIALIDNYDSFSFIIYDYLARHGDVRVFRNTDSLDCVKSLDLSGIVISPGPSHPAHSLLSLQVLDHFKGRLPILGICLGMQAIGLYFGKRIRRARSIMHGKVDSMEHFGGTLFCGHRASVPGGEVPLPGGGMRRPRPGCLRALAKRRRSHGNRASGSKDLRSPISSRIVRHP